MTDFETQRQEEYRLIKLAEAAGYWRCDCGDEDGLPHCGWWFKDRKAYIREDILKIGATLQ